MLLSAKSVLNFAVAFPLDRFLGTFEDSKAPKSLIHETAESSSKPGFNLSSRARSPSARKPWAANRVDFGPNPDTLATSSYASSSPAQAFSQDSHASASPHFDCSTIADSADSADSSRAFRPRPTTATHTFAI